MANDSLAGEFGTIAGWGMLSDDDPTLPEFPHFAYDRPIISNAECHAQLGTPFFIKETNVCIDTSDGEGGICYGDSGGPLQLQPAEGVHGGYVQASL